MKMLREHRELIARGPLAANRWIDPETRYLCALRLLCDSISRVTAKSGGCRECWNGKYASQTCAEFEGEC
jgi:hypothetical protein